jgi:putative endonuclease
MTNKRNGTLYVGVTSDLQKRVWEHRTHANPNGFTAKYNCNMLVYYCGFHRIEDAIVEEKRLKGGNRKAKLALIESINPKWIDLWEEVKEW